MSVYNVERRLETALLHLEDFDITQKNKQEIKNFLGRLKWSDFLMLNTSKTPLLCWGFEHKVL